MPSLSENSAEIESAGVRGRPIHWLPVAVSLVAILAALVSGYLAITSALDHQPVGCGAGQGCGEVLSSRYAKVLGVPLGAPAVCVHLLIAAGLLAAARGSRTLVLWCGLLVLVGAVASSAGWFVAVQAFIVKAWCRWCLLDHALGLVECLGVLACVPWTVSLTSSVGNRRIPLAAGAAAGVLGVFFTGVLALIQSVQPYDPPVVRLPMGINHDSGPGPDRRISVLGGELQISPHSEPRLGSADAPVLLLVLFDYCCPHCRSTHAELLKIEKQAAGRLGIVLLPMPLDNACNSEVKEIDMVPRFRHACELARLALAVWRAKPAVYREFDEWMFEPELPRAPRDVRGRAAQLVGETALQAALADPDLEKDLQRNIRAYISSQAERIPVLLSPGTSGVSGRPGSNALLKLIRDELKVPLTNE